MMLPMHYGTIAGKVTKVFEESSCPTISKIPVILHHGILGSPDTRIGPLKLRYYRGIDVAMRSLGHPVVITRVHPTASIARRAGELHEIVNRKLDAIEAEKGILIAHSMGGLDARYAITHLGLADRVSALLTVSAPHRGSSFADWWKLHIGRRLGAFQLAMSLRLDINAVNDLTLDSCREFNEKTPDVSTVRYYSVGASRPWHRIPAFAIPAHRIIQKVEGDNDGLVSVRSSLWGTSLGVWPADHWHTINHRMVLEFKKPTGSITPYYLAALKRIEEDLEGCESARVICAASSEGCSAHQARR
jgi:triacylglycerol lipase